MAWKKEFDAKQRLPGTGREKKSESQKKLTGKELFLQNSTLNESDLKFISGTLTKQTWFYDMQIQSLAWCWNEQCSEFGFFCDTSKDNMSGFYF